MAQAIPVSRDEWEAAHAHIPSADDPIVDAVAFFVDCRQSQSGLMKGFTPVTLQPHSSRDEQQRSPNGCQRWTACRRFTPVYAVSLSKICQP